MGEEEEGGEGDGWMEGEGEKTTITFLYIYTEWKGNKCHPFNCRRGRLKLPKKYISVWGLNLIVFSEKKVVSCSVLFTSYNLYR